MTNNIQGGHPSYNIADKLYVLKWKSVSLKHKISELVKCSLDTYKSNLSTADSVIKGFNVTEFNIQSMAACIMWQNVSVTWTVFIFIRNWILQIVNAWNRFCATYQFFLFFQGSV